MESRWTRAALSVKIGVGIQAEMSNVREAGGEACSACARPRSQVKQLHPARAGGKPGLLLCDLCVAECAMAIADAPTRIPGGQHHCDFCGKAEGHVAILVAVSARKVCDECVDAYGGFPG